MGVRICPDCRGKVSESRNECPHCGYIFPITHNNENAEKPKVKKRTINKKTIIGSSIAIVFVLCWFTFLFVFGFISFEPPMVKVLDNGAVTGLTEYGKVQTEIIIPKYLNGIKIKSISYSAFEGCTNLTSITISDEITSIGWMAFRNCTGLTSISIPDSVKSIGMGAFEGCTGLTSISIPDGVTSIGYGAFEGCTDLTSITIGKGITSMESRSFDGCTSLTFITIPDSVTSIGRNAFYGCSALTSVTIPNSVTSIEDGAFSNCATLSSVSFTGTKAQWKAIPKGIGWRSSTPFTVVHCTDGDVAVD